MSKNTMLTTASGYNTKNMIFADPVSATAPTQPPLPYKRVQISTRNPDKSVGDLVLLTPRVYSFGIDENTDPTTKKKNGYSLSLCLYDQKNGVACPTEEQTAFVKTFDAIIARCKAHIMDNKETLEKYDLEEAELKKLNPLYYKREMGKIVPGRGPTFYAKLMYGRKSEKIVTTFKDVNDNVLDPMSNLKRHCFATAAIKFESIFVGTKIAVQIKVYEARLEFVENTFRSLLPRVESNTTMSLTNPNERTEGDGFDDDEYTHVKLNTNTSVTTKPKVVDPDDDEEEAPKPILPVVTKKKKKVSE